MSKEIILQVKNVTKKFGELIALNDLSFNVHKGELLGLIGPNGAGKTTLFNIITGFYKPDKGQIIFENKNITGLKPYKICEMGIARTFQIVQPFLNLSVIKNVMVGSFLRAKDRSTAEKIAMEWLNFLGLEKKKDFLAKELTLPELRKLELARALATSPKLLLIDEVVAGLTPTEVDEVIETIKKIWQSGITIVMVEHVMRAIMSISKRVIVLNYGIKIAEGSPEEVSKNKEVIMAYLGVE